MTKEEEEEEEWRGGRRKRSVSLSLSLGRRRRRINPSPTRDLFHARPLDFIGARTRFQGRMNVREMRRFPTKWRDNKLLHADKNSPPFSLLFRVHFRFNYSRIVTHLFQLYCALFREQ